MVLTKIDALLFDLDGTLVDSRGDLTDAVNHALKATGHPAQTQDEIIPHVGNGMRVLLSEVLGPVSDEVLASAVEAFSDFYTRHCLDKTRLYPGVEAVLKGLNKRYALGVVTNKPTNFADKILRGLSIRDYLTTVVGGDSVREKKPHPEPLLKATRDLGANAGATLIVGDGQQDILAGQAAGARTCAARYGFGFRTEIMDLRPDFSIDAFKELKEIVS